MNFQKYFILFFGLFIYQFNYNQSFGQENITCDSLIQANDLDILTLTPIQIKENGKINICYQKGHIVYLTLTEKGMGSAKIRTKKYDVDVIPNGYLLTFSDTTSGVHVQKHLYDSIVILRKTILFQRKFFTKERELIKTQVKIVTIDTISSSAKMFDCTVPYSFNLNYDIVKSEIFDDAIIAFSKNYAEKEMEFKLEGEAPYFRFKQKSLFVIMNDFFLDFYIESLKK